MSGTIQTISLGRLALAFLPVAVVVGMLFRWSIGVKTAMYALARMLVQLLLVGYVLTYIFDAQRAIIVVLVLSLMLFVASWISLRPLQQKDARSYFRAVLAITVGGLSTLALITQGVLNVEPWYKANLVIPLAGMIFANSMNALSLAAERFHAERSRGLGYEESRRAALNTALIPLVNSLLAVGIVSFPGMMTGQILSGVGPLIAARYQIMVMCMIFGSAGLAAGVFLLLLKPAE